MPVAFFSSPVQSPLNALIQRGEGTSGCRLGISTEPSLLPHDWARFLCAKLHGWFFRWFVFNFEKGPLATVAVVTSRYNPGGRRGGGRRRRRRFSKNGRQEYEYRTFRLWNFCIYHLALLWFSNCVTPPINRQNEFLPLWKVTFFFEIYLKRKSWDLRTCLKKW